MPDVITIYSAAPQARVRLFCLPYAGGSAAMFREWSVALAPTVEVCAVEFAGHGQRFNEPLQTELGAIVATLAEAMQPHLDKPFALFGHSMGALVAFELTHHLRSNHPPQHLFVSAHRAPHLPHPAPDTHLLPQAAFLGHVQSLGGFTPDVLEQRELVDLLLPIMRADFKACNTYQYVSRPSLATPITAFGGLQDAMVSQAELAAWGELTTGPFMHRLFAGGHFYFQHAQPLLLNLIAYGVS